MQDPTTDLDAAHAAMEAELADDAVRLRFYERLADSELFLLLAGEATGEQIEPELFEVEDQQFTLIFDRQERLAQFVGQTAPYAGLPGRVLVGMLAGQGIGMALNPDVAPSAMLIPAEAVDWLAATLTHKPDRTEARLTSLNAPGKLPEAVVTGLDRKLATAAGLARYAYLATAEYEDGGMGHVLAFIDALPDAEQALALAANEALTFSGVEAGVIDVMFVRATDPLAARLAKVGLRFDLPVPVRPDTPAAPGMDPEKPPRLR